MMWQEYLTKQKTPLPVFDGFIAAELSAEPIPFHFVRTDAMEWDSAGSCHGNELGTYRL